MMKRKLTVVMMILTVFLLMVPNTALAYYDTVVGELRDIKTKSLWQYGGSVAIYDGTGTLLGSDTLDPGDSSFSVGVSVSTFTVMYVVVTFNAGPDPSDEVETKTITAVNTSGDSGTLNIGSVYKDTGPNAVSFTNVTAHSPNVWLPVGIVAGVSTLAMGALIVIRKRR
jgi:hypothetical protein